MRQALEALLDALVNVEQPELQVQHGFARDAKSEVPRLDHARMHGPDGHLEYAFAGDRAERVEIAGYPRDPLQGDVFPKRPHAIRPVIVQGHALGIGMPLGNQTEEVRHLALEPVRGRVLRRDRGKRQVGRLYRRRDVQERSLRGQRPEVMQHEIPGRRALVSGEERQKSPVEPVHDLIGDRGQCHRRGVERQLPLPRCPERRLGHAEPRGHHRDSRHHAPPQTTSTAARIRAISGTGR